MSSCNGARHATAGAPFECPKPLPVSLVPAYLCQAWLGDLTRARAPFTPAAGDLAAPGLLQGGLLPLSSGLGDRASAPWAPFPGPAAPR